MKSFTSENFDKLIFKMNYCQIFFKLNIFHWFLLQSQAHPKSSPPKNGFQKYKPMPLFYGYYYCIIFIRGFHKKATELYVMRCAIW